MSGPVSDGDAPPTPSDGEASSGPALEISDSRVAEVGGLDVHRALPRPERRTVGAWCFADHFGPTSAASGASMQIGPHPHIGLQTVTWLFAGEVVHHDSLGSEQLVRPGELNLMTAGRGIAHAEQTPEGYQGPTHGVQLWVALPDEARHGPAAFDHHADLPEVEVGAVSATVLIGRLAGATSPASVHTPMIGVDLVVRAGGATLPLDPTFEHALLAVEGSCVVEGATIEPSRLAYLGLGRGELVIDGDPYARVLLLGGAPFGEQILMWWNFVARTRAEIDDAREDWQSRSDRFGEVASSLDRIPAPRPSWSGN